MATIDQVGQLPPHDIEAEEACVAAALVSSEAVDALEFVRPEMLFREKNGWIWAAILDIARGRDVADARTGRNAGGYVNTITVAHQLLAGDRLVEVGGQSYLNDLIRRLPTAVGAEFYGRIVEQCPVAKVFSAPGHPYTAMLRDASPIPDPSRRGILPRVVGEIPSAAAPPPG